MSAVFDAGGLPVSPSDVLGAAARLDGVAHRTALASSRTLNSLAGGVVVCKCENFQRAGAFKFRGAYNALRQLSAEDRERGVLSYSSGNHAQALALAGQLLGIATTIIMPGDAPAVKLRATRGYGANIIIYDRAEVTREALAARLTREQRLPVIPPYDHPHIVAGQGTAALELIQDTEPLDYLLVPCGGGGLLSGSALAAHAAAERCRVIGVEPANADDATRSFRTGRLHHVENPDTIADGARTPSLGRITFPLIRHLVHDMVTVREEDIWAATRFLWERMKLVVEPTGSLGIAALMSGAFAARGARIGVMLSGGNADLELWAGA